MSEYNESKQGQPHIVNEGFVFRLSKIYEVLVVPGISITTYTRRCHTELRKCRSVQDYRENTEV